MLDTNVFVELHTCADLIRDFDELHAELGDAALAHPTVRYRIAVVSGVESVLVFVRTLDKFAMRRLKDIFAVAVREPFHF
jgi:hypothetical protein